VRTHQLVAHTPKLAMRNALHLPIALLLSTVAAQSQKDVFSPFVQPFVDDSFDNSTRPELELLKRQSGCPSNYFSCSYLGAAGLCCKNNSLCSADNVGHVACCPQGAVCTGTLGGTGVGAAATFASASASTTVGFVQATTTAAATIGTATTSGLLFVGATGGSQTSGASSRSYVPNPYYPAFPYIPTTYQNAAACSSAYTTCQSDFASCTSYLGGSAGAHGVTVSAPNGGVTVAGPTTTYAPSFATAVCSSISSQGCFGLVVEACGNFGTGGGSQGAAPRCTGVLKYGAGVGVAVGLAGQVFGYS
jgi:hypothetical protein